MGVIVNLARVFGEAVVFPKGLRHAPDLFAIAATAAGFVVLHGFKKDVTWVVLGGGVLGLAWRPLK